MNRWVAIGLLGALVMSLLGLGQTTVLLDDDFENYMLGTLPIGPTRTWCYLDTFSNSDPGWPKVEYDGPTRGQVLHVYSPWTSSRQHPGAIVNIPAISHGESLDLTFDLRLNSSTSYFFLEIVDRYFREIGATGCVTEDPRAPVWSLEGVNWNGVNNPGTLAIGLRDTPEPDDPNCHCEKAFCSATLIADRWYSFKLVHTPGLLELYLDGTSVGKVTHAVYDLGEAQDWMLTFGDADSHADWRTDISIDNILLVVFLTSNAEYVPQPRLVGDTAANGDGSWLITTKNVGAAPYAGPLRFSSTLSYYRGWYGESVTEFFSYTLPHVSLMPGETFIAEFREISEGDQFGTLLFPDIVEEATEQTLQLTIPMPSQDSIDVFQEMIYNWWTTVSDKEPDTDYIDLTISGTACHLYVPVVPYFTPPR